MLSKTLCAIQLLSETPNKPLNVSFKNKTTTAFEQDYEDGGEISRTWEQIAQTRPKVECLYLPEKRWGKAAKEEWSFSLI